MSLIYAPAGRAAEYSPLALSLFSGGCPHACRYCYCQRIFPGWGKTPKTRDLRSLAKEAAKASEQILLSFVTDPYADGGDVLDGVLAILSKAGCSVAILTKAGTAPLRHLDVFKTWPGGRIKVGASLTFLSESKSREWEPGAALPVDRLLGLADLKEAGIRTWASCEPVIEPAETLGIMEAAAPFVDDWAVGKLSGDPVREKSIDWPAFAARAIPLARTSGRLYVKNDLRAAIPAGLLRPEECRPETIRVEPRPANGSRTAKGELQLF